MSLLLVASFLVVDILLTKPKGHAMPHSPKVRKDGPASVEFYTKHMGMTLLAQKDFPQWKFSLQRDFKNSLG